MDIYKSKNTGTKAAMLVGLFLIAAVIMQSCGGGGGGGSDPSTGTPVPATNDPASPAPANARISGKVIIKGVEDYSGAIVIAEQVTDGVTRSVGRMLDQARTGQRTTLRAAGDTAGVYTTQTEADGSFSLMVPEGTYSIYAHKNDTVAAQPQRILAQAAAPVVVDFDLVATGKISGMADIGASGSDLVVVFLEGTSFASYAAADGSFEISNVPVGTYTIVFARGGTKYASNAGVEVTAGATTNSDLTSVSIACVMDSDCADGNDYTADSCNIPGGDAQNASCAFATVACISDLDCDDGDANTLDTCTDPFLAIAACNHSLTVAAGDISANTTWALANSPITVQGQIRIAEGVTLTIEPGVVVQFNYPNAGAHLFAAYGSQSSLSGIRVDGTLIAQGTIANPIEFTLSPDVREYGGGFWGGIYFTSTQTGSILQHAILNYPSYAIAVDSTNPTISNVEIKNVDAPLSQNYDSYHVFAKTIWGWQDVSVEHLGLKYERKHIDVSRYLPDADGEYKLRIAQVGGHAAQIDALALVADGMELKPVSAVDLFTASSALRKISALDNDVVDAHEKTFEVMFETPARAPARAELSLVAREENREVIEGGRAFTYPRNQFYDTANTAGTYSYKLGSNPGAMNVDGVLTAGDNLPATAFADFTTPMSGHPAGTTYGYFKDDGRILYAALDFTSDNTYDDDADYAALHVRVGNQFKTFRVDVAQNRYGAVGFNYSGNVNYQHKVYEFQIPLSEIGNPARGEKISYVFEAYGTASLFQSAVSVNSASAFTMSDVSISFMPGSTGYMYGLTLMNMQDESSHSLSNISIKNASYGGAYFQYVDNLAISGLTITNTQEDYGMYVYSVNNFTCDDCHVSNTSDYEYNAYINYSSDVALSNCSFKNGMSDGVYFDYLMGTNSITNCEFSGNGSDGLEIYGPQSGSSLAISNSLFSGNCSSGLSYNSYGYGESATIMNTDFVNNGNSGIYGGGTPVLALASVFFSGNNGAGDGVVDSSTATPDSDSPTAQYYGVASVTTPAASQNTGFAAQPVAFCNNY